MKNGMLKKAVAVGMATVMLFGMAGCGKREEAQQTEKQNSNEMVYRGEELVIDGVLGDYSDICVQDDRLYFTTYDWVQSTGEDSDFGKLTDEEGEDIGSEEQTSEEGGDTPSEEQTSEEGEDTCSEEQTSEEREDTDSEDEEYYEDTITIQRLYSANLDGSNLKEIPLPGNGQKWLQFLSIEPDGLISFLLSSYNETTRKSEITITRIDEQGNELVNQEVGQTLGLGENNNLSQMIVDGEGRFLIATDQAIFVFHENGEFDKKIKISSFLSGGVALTKDGKVVCGTNSDESAQAQLLDVDVEEWGEAMKLDMNYFPSADSLMNGIEYDFYYKDESGIYGYDMEGEKSITLMDYVVSNVSPDSIWGIKPAGKDRMLGTEYADGRTKLILYSKVDPSTITEKRVITLGCLYGDYEVRNAAVEFNKNSDQYRIEIKDYSNEEDPITKMNTDIIAGNFPDIMDWNNISIGQYVAKGLLEDLTPYFEKDSELNVEDILDSVLEALQVDGKLYSITPGFDIYTIVARRSDVGDKMGWTFDDLKSLLEKKGDSVQLFYWNDKFGMLNTFATGMNDFIDWQTGECRFDSQDFKDILEICNQGTSDEVLYDEDAQSMPALIREGRVLFEDGKVAPEQIQLYKKIFEGDITYIGYPDEDRQGSYFSFETMLGMYSGSEVKEGAWEFIRTFLTKEYQGDNEKMYLTPTRKDCFDMMMRAKTATEAYTDELGQEIDPLESSWGFDEVVAEITPLSQEEADMYIELVNSTRKCNDYDDNIMTIIREEAAAYFAGEKSLDETADIIQNRIKTYVNESR